MNADYQELQGMIDTAVATDGIVYVNRNYTIDKPLVAAKWNSGSENYDTTTIKIVGKATMWDSGRNSVVTATFKDAPILSTYRHKGSLIDGINFQGGYRTPVMTDEQFFNADFATYGDKTCRDSPYSPYASVAFDAFASTVPADGGYPGLTSYYRGKGSGGSTGCVINNCTVNNTTAGIVLSPSGLTANNELHTFSNIRSYHTKALFVGGQAQEKSNRLINVNCWGRCHTVLQFGGYGTGTPGLYFVDGMQIAGGVNRLINRTSGWYYPIHLNNVFAESLGSIGQWQTELTDKMSNSVIHFQYSSITKSYPSKGHVYGGGVTFENCVLRYYGQPTLPLFFSGNYTFSGKNVVDQPIITGKRATDVRTDYKMTNLGATSTNQIPASAGILPVGTNIAFCDTNSYPYYGVATIGADGVTMVNIPKDIIPGKSYAIFKKTNL